MTDQPHAEGQSEKCMLILEEKGSHGSFKSKDVTA
jgi:hypothetical protein